MCKRYLKKSQVFREGYAKVRSKVITQRSGHTAKLPKPLTTTNIINMANKKEEGKSIEDLIGNLYTKINRCENQIKKLKKELDTLRDRRFNVDGEKDDEEDDAKKQALKQEIDMFIKAVLAPQPSKFADDGYVDAMSYNYLT